MFQVDSTMLRAGRPEAAAAVWNWMDAANQKKQSEPGGWGNPRVRGSVQGVVALSVGFAVRTFWFPHLGTVLMAMGGIFLLTALISPGGLYAGVERALLWLGNTLSKAISWVLLASVFYLFFLPYGRVFKSGRRDPMKRFYEPDAETYWEPRVRGRSASASRTKQY